MTMDVFWSTERVFKLSSLRGAYLFTFAASFLLTEWGRKVYRPYVYRAGIRDWGLADVVGNLLGTLTVVFFHLSVAHATPAQGLRIVGLVTVGLMVYEIVQGVLPRSVFDWKDLIATLLAGLVAVGMLTIIHRFWSGGAAASVTAAEESI